MFNLEQFIADWRQQMLAAGIKTPVPLDELESHLREEVERQIKFGVGERHAFEIAAKTIGRGVELKKEFRNGEPLESQLVKLLSIGCNAVACIFSLWCLSILLTVETNLMTKATSLLAVATMVLSWRYNYKFLPMIPNHWIRSMTGFACVIGAVIMIQLFIIYVLPDLMIHPATVDMPLGRVLVMFLWAWTAMAILGGVGHGLEKAARARTATFDS